MPRLLLVFIIIFILLKMDGPNTKFFNALVKYSIQKINKYFRDEGIIHDQIHIVLSDEIHLINNKSSTQNWHLYTETEFKSMFNKTFEPEGLTIGIQTLIPNADSKLVLRFFSSIKNLDGYLTLTLSGKSNNKIKDWKIHVWYSGDEEE
ncbi:MAG TPA: hypothetical protein VFV79_10255 [Saprospiraceae bacterium]|nr:hypothetical protein [Saprospiraceae bacterium]